MKDGDGEPTGYDYDYEKISSLDIQKIVYEKIKKMDDLINVLKKHKGVQIKNDTFIQQTKRYTTIGLFLILVEKKKGTTDEGIFDSYLQELVRILYNNKPKILEGLFNDIQNYI